jgi:hypothetical protein
MSVSSRTCTTFLTARLGGSCTVIAFARRRSAGATFIIVAVRIHLTAGPFATGLSFTAVTCTNVTR